MFGTQIENSRNRKNSIRSINNKKTSTSASTTVKYTIRKTVSTAVTAKAKRNKAKQNKEKQWLVVNQNSKVQFCKSNKQQKQYKIESGSGSRK